MKTPTVTGQQALTLPISPLTPLDPNVRPTVEAISLLHNELYENAASMRSQYGEGQNGLPGMLMPPEEYNTIAPRNAIQTLARWTRHPDLEEEGAEEMK